MALVLWGTAANASTRAPVATGISAPLRFEPQAGQCGGFRARAGGYQVMVSGQGVLIGVSGRSPEEDQHRYINLRFEGANPLTTLAGTEKYGTTVNYLWGDDPKEWRRQVPTYAKVRCAQVYPGIDLIYYGNEQQLEFDLVVAPGSDPRQIRLLIEGADGLEVDKAGDLSMQYGAARLRQPRPRVYQERGSRRREIQGRYVMEGDQRHVVIGLGDYDPDKPLVIDPVLVYSTYLGGLLEDSARGIAVDAQGNMYVVGTTTSANFPIQGDLTGGTPGSTNAFVTKISAAGDRIIYSTYLGGKGVSKGYGIAVDSNGNAIVMGSTTAINFPVIDALQPSNGGGTDFFVCKLDSSGSALLFSTYLGGSGDEPYGPSFPIYDPNEGGNPLSIGPDGSIYVVGSTSSTDFPGVNPLQPSSANAVMANISAGGNLLYSTTFFGKSGTEAHSIAVDPLGNAYVAGSTWEDDLGTPDAVFPNYIGPWGPSVFVAKVNPAGTGLVYCTYLSGRLFPKLGSEWGLGIAADGEGNAYVTGSTSSFDFPTVNAAQSQCGGGPAPGPPVLALFSDAFVTKINPAGTALVYSTFLGGYANYELYESPGGWETGDFGR
jgi:hypothetical protein